jgi:hypothetical protein
MVKVDDGDAVDQRRLARFDGEQQRVGTDLAGASRVYK